VPVHQRPRCGRSIQSLDPMFNRVVDWWRRKRQAQRDALMFERQVVVTFDDSSVTSTFPKGPPQTIDWDAVNSVVIMTDDSGPWGDDLWWFLEGANGCVSYPGGATGDLEMLAELQRRLPNFQDSAVIAANGSTSVARFVCWQRIPG
jgi:hypothetical protein